MPIDTYCDLYCGGVKKEFARRFGRLPQNVTLLFKHPEQWSVRVSDECHVLEQVKAYYTPEI